MTTWNGWTPELKSEWFRLRSEGRTHKEIGEALGCGKNASVGQVRVNKGDPRPSGMPTVKEFPADDLAEIKRLVGLGFSRDRICKIMHRGADTLMKLLGPVPVKQKPQRELRYEQAAKQVSAEKPRRAPRRTFVAPRVQGRGCCLYLIGDEKPWRQCDQPIERGSYCLPHYRQTHILFPTKQEREAA